MLNLVNQQIPKMSKGERKEQTILDKIGETANTSQQ
jgi:hypothetical protein